MSSATNAFLTRPTALVDQASTTTLYSVQINKVHKCVCSTCVCSLLLCNIFIIFYCMQNIKYVLICFFSTDYRFEGAVPRTMR